MGQIQIHGCGLAFLCGNLIFQIFGARKHRLQLRAVLGNQAVGFFNGTERNGNFAFFEFLAVFLVQAGFARLTVQLFNLFGNQRDRVGQARQVHIHALQAADTFLAFGFVFGYAGHFLKHFAALLRRGGKHTFHAALVNNGVAFAADAGVQEQIAYVAQTALHLIQIVFAFAGAENFAADGNFIKIQRQVTRGIVKHHADLRHIQRGAFGRTVKNNIHHRGRAQRLPAHFADGPAYGIYDVGLTAAVGAHHAGNAGLKVQANLIGKRFETDDFYGF